MIQKYNFFMTLYIHFFTDFFSLFGNHPFSTRFCWWKSSPIDQNDENAKTPQKDERITLCRNNAATIPPIPKTKNIHQHFTPK